MTVPNNIRLLSDDQVPKHIVSPEAIREALKEEKEEALGYSQRRPFSQYSSFNALKQTSFSLPPKEGNDDYDIDTVSMATITTVPKRPPNAYLLFNRDMRKQSPQMSVAEISKEVGDWWKLLSDDKRDYYVKEAYILKQEHLKKYPNFIYTRKLKAELAGAKQLGRKSSLKHQQEKKSRKSMSSLNGQRDPRRRKKKRHKHPFAPKHPMSAYLYYLASVYPSVSLNFPGSTVGPISKSISKTWHAMSNEQRIPWKQKAESDKVRYANLYGK